MHTRTSRAALVVPLVLVNVTAVYGQAAWAYTHLVPADVRAVSLAASITLCLLFAATVESVGIYLAYEAHAALMEDQSSALLRLGSYAVALVVGALNYAHFAGPGWRPNPLAVTFGLLSSLSPWLWAIRSRSLHRASLLDRGLVDPRSVRFTLAQRVLYPARSFGAYRLAVWNGVNSPSQARADYDTRQAQRGMPREVPAVGAELPASRPADGVTAPATPPGIEASSGPSEPGTDDRQEPATVAALLAPPSPSNGGRGGGHNDATEPVTKAARKAPRMAPAKRQTTAVRVAKTAAKMPGAPVAAIAKKAGVSESTARRYMPPSNGRPAAAEPTEGAPMTESRRIDGQPETDADRRFFDEREAGYTGPLDQDGHRVPADHPHAQILARMQETNTAEAGDEF